MNKIELYTGNDFDVQIVMIENEPWFVASHLCKVLEISDTFNAVKDLEKSEKLARILYVSGQNREVILISEAGLYKVLMRSNKPKAKPFQNWLAREVIPTIRKTGSYSTNKPIPQTFQEALRLAADLMDEKEKLEKQAALDAPKVKSYDELMSSEGLYSMSQVAKLIGKLGRNKTFALLREKGILMNNNEPYQKHIDNGHFAVKTYALNGKKCVQTFATSKGLDFMRALINGN